MILKSWRDRKLIFFRKVETMKTLVKFLKDEKGLETVEWAIIAALIVAALVGIITSLGNNVQDAFEKLETATTPVP